MAKVGKYKEAKFEDSIRLIRSALEWAEKQDVERLRKFLLESANMPLYCFSSGGSSATNDYLALLYETNIGMAKSLTPLAMTNISDEALKSAKIIITSGGGHGVDEKYTVNRAASVNPKGVCGITSSNDGHNIVINTLKKVTDNWFFFNTPKLDGFIGTVSISGMFGVIYKTFTNDGDFVRKLDFDLTPTHCYSYTPRVEGDIPSFKDIKNYIALYNGWSSPIAQDFESKMVECGIASVQMCDYRNYCHGRFIFLSRHLEESALVLFITPREKEYAKRLILEGKTFRGGYDVFPKNTPIIIIETELDNPLATIDLMIKMQVCFNDIAKANRLSDDDDPCNPDNPNGIDKRFPRSLDWGNMAEMESLNNGNINGSTGTLKCVSRKKVINYNPKKSIGDIARENGVSVATVRKFIIDKNIDRNRDEKLNTYNEVWYEYIKDSDVSRAALARKLKMSVNTVNLYLGMKADEIELEHGKVGMAIEHPIVKERRRAIQDLQERFDKFCKVRNRYPNLTAGEYLKRLSWVDDKNGKNLAMVVSFMQMKEFMYKFKDKEIEFVSN